MGEKLTAFFKNQDQLGSGANLNYRGTPKYGTILGGCLSLSACISLAIFLITQIYDWAQQPSYTLQVTNGYLDNNSNSYTPDPYEIDTSNFLPTFVLISENETGDYVFNDPKLFQWKFYDSNDSDISTIPCNELIRDFKNLKNDYCD